MISVEAERRITRTIELHNIHIQGMLPVPIRQIARNEGWTVFYREGVFPLYGFAIVREPHKIMGINADISLQWQRATIAHEMGHYIAGHRHGLNMLTERPWTWTKEEREASEIGARLLVPEWSLQEYQTIAELAAACDVPGRIVENRLGDW